MSEQEKSLAAYAKIATQTGIDEETIAVIHNSVAKNTSLFELTYFLNVAKGIGLNPFNKEVWCYKDTKGNLIVTTGRDGFLSIAQRHPRYNGIRSGVVCKNDTFQLEQGSAKPNVKHIINAGDRGDILGAWCIAYIKDGEETFAWADFKDFNKGRFTWETHPKEMILKVAESRALKKAFGITGVHAREEFEVIEGVAIPVRGGETKTLN